MWFHKPSTNDVSSVIVAALRRPAGKFKPILSNLSRRARPPFFDLALYAANRYAANSCFTLHVNVRWQLSTRIYVLFDHWRQNPGNLFCWNSLIPLLRLYGINVLLRNAYIGLSLRQRSQRGLNGGLIEAHILSAILKRSDCVCGRLGRWRIMTVVVRW
jgi:hypothetical protein